MAVTVMVTPRYLPPLLAQLEGRGVKRGVEMVRNMRDGPNAADALRPMTLIGKQRRYSISESLRASASGGASAVLSGVGLVSFSGAHVEGSCLACW